MQSGFKQFILRGNVVDMAVGVVIGAAFASVVGALTKDLLTPLIAAIVKAPDFSALKYTLNGSQFMYGEFLNAPTTIPMAWFESRWLYWVGLSTGIFGVIQST